MATGNGPGGVILPDAVQASIAEAAATPAPVTPAPALEVMGAALPGGVSAVPVDESTLIQLVIPPCNNPLFSGKSLSGNLCVRILNKDGTLTYGNYAVNWTASAGAFLQSDLAPGYLISASFTLATTGIPSGVVFVTAGLVHQSGPGVPYDTLLVSGWASSYNPAGWPQGVLQDVSSGQGAPFMGNGSAVAAGHNITFTMPSESFTPLLLTAQLTTSSAAANRYAFLDVGLPSVGAWELAVSTWAQVASLTVTYTFALTPVQVVDTVAEVALIPMPPLANLPAGAILTIGADNLQSGDQFATLTVYGKAWL